MKPTNELTIHDLLQEGQRMTPRKEDIATFLEAVATSKEDRNQSTDRETTK